MSWNFLPLPSVCAHISASIGLGNLIMICCDVVFLIFIESGVCWAYWINMLEVFHIFRKLGVITSWNILSFFPFPFFSCCNFCLTTRSYPTVHLCFGFFRLRNFSEVRRWHQGSREFKVSGFTETEKRREGTHYSIIFFLFIFEYILQS